jgi:hypothetical protein
MEAAKVSESDFKSLRISGVNDSSELNGFPFAD